LFRTSRLAHEHRGSKQAPAVFPGPLADAPFSRYPLENLPSMLEHDSLLLQHWGLYKKPPPWGRGEDGISPPVWAMLEPNSRALVGLARHAASSKGRWASWFGRATLAVYESEDEPLLCTLHHRWGFFHTWHLLDADDHMVGRIARSGLQGTMGRNLLTVRDANTATTAFRDLQGRTFATLARQGYDHLLSFTNECKGDPFGRMLVLGAALVLKDN
jgi:hypothetical protein